MSNQKPWTLLQVGDKVVFRAAGNGETTFTITSSCGAGYSGTWSGTDVGPLVILHWEREPSWWGKVLRVEKAGEAPWYTKLAVGDTFRGSLGTVFTVAVVGEATIEALWNNPLNGGRTHRGTFPLFDSWITDPTLAFPVSVAALQPPPITPTTTQEGELDIDLRDDPIEPPTVTRYPRHNVPTIPLEELAVGEAVDVPVARYTEEMIRGMVKLCGERAEPGARKIFGLISNETTHTIWREM